MAKLSARRTRLSSGIRELTREARPVREQFIQPLFSVQGLQSREAVPGLNGVHRDTSDSLLRQIEADLKAGISKFILFLVPAEKSTQTFATDYAATEIAAIRKHFGNEIWLATDVCLCSATTHGHCGVLNEAGDYIDNEFSVRVLAGIASAYASAGADCVAPSDMMDGRVGSIREQLSATSNDRTLIMSYSAKFHSGFYGPFRLAAESAPSGHGILHDRASYQIDPARPSDAAISSQRDSDEGADILMVKPGMPYLDVLAELSRQIPKPWAVFQTSGETAALELVAANNLGDRARMTVETWTAFVRAGAQMIISYDARRAHEWL